MSIASIDPVVTGTKYGITANSVIKALSVTGLEVQVQRQDGGTQDLNLTDFEVKII